MTRAAAWTCTGAFVVLGARVLAYALVPGPTLLSRRLEHSVGGPSLVLIGLAVLAVAVAVSAAAVGLAALAVRERLSLETSPVVDPPRLRPLRFVVRFAVLAVGASVAFVLVESYVHWRAGLGWHGLHCLIGPVHRDALPVVAALSLVAVALFEAVEHLLAWARRTLVRLHARARVIQPERSKPPILVAQPRRWWIGGALNARGPPRRLSAVSFN